MKTTLFVSACLSAAAAFVPGARAQAPVVTPTTPAPAVNMSPADPLPAPDRVIYGQRLPTPEELRSVAAAQGLTLDRIEQTNGQIVAVYRNASGQTSVTSYQVMPTSGVAPGQTQVTTVVPASRPSTTVVYESAPDVVYYDPYYYPWYSPIRVGVGLGFSYRGGGYRGGYHGGGWYHGGGHFGHR